MKKILCFVIMATLLFSSMALATIKTEEVKQEVSQLEKIYDENYEETDLTKYQKIGEQLIADFKAGIQNKSIPTYKYYYPDKFFQNSGEDWDDDNMESDDEFIEDAGCALTSFTMLASLHGSNDDPGDVNTTMGNYACPFGWDVAQTNYSLEQYHYSTSVLSDSTAKSTLIGLLAEEDVVVVGMRLESDHTETHYVLARGYVYGSSGAAIYIYDPGYVHDYSRLQYYFDDGYEVNRIIYYSNN
jgi:hypothetical protein